MISSDIKTDLKQQEIKKSWQMHLITFYRGTFSKNLKYSVKDAFNLGWYFIQ